MIGWRRRTFGAATGSRGPADRVLGLRHRCVVRKGDAVPTLWLDHFESYVDAPSLDTYLRHYRQAGFLVAERMALHGTGARHGLVGFGPEHIELCVVEHEGRFARLGGASTVLRASRRPFAIGMTSHSARLQAPPGRNFRPLGQRQDPGGAICSVYPYLGRRALPLGPAPNTAYAIAGVTFVSPTPQERAAAWRALFAPETTLRAEGDTYHVTVGAHDLGWMTPEQYSVRYGRAWEPAPHPYGELAALHVLASDLTMVQTMVAAAGWEALEFAASVEPRRLFLPADQRGGFTFLVTERPREAWRIERVSRSGENLDLAKDRSNNW